MSSYLCGSFFACSAATVAPSRMSLSACTRMERQFSHALEVLNQSTSGRHNWMAPAIYKVDCNLPAETVQAESGWGRP